MPPKLFDRVRRTSIKCRAFSGKINAVAEMFGKESSMTAVRMSPYKTEQFFTELARQMNDAIGHKEDGDIVFTADDDTPHSASFDARRMCMIIYHLVSNAIKHGGTDNKNVSIRCRLRKDNFEIEVQDHGNGVPQEIKATLFDRFAEDFDIKSQMIGALPPRINGLGLPLCKKLASDMNGDIKFRNYATGARFTVVIPQKSGRFSEAGEFYPDDILMEQCMGDLLCEIAEKRELAETESAT